jgi:hypothetical protein
VIIAVSTAQGDKHLVTEEAAIDLLRHHRIQ